MPLEIYSNPTRFNTNVTILSNLTVTGDITASGKTFFSNTVFTTTSALSVINIGNAGPALYVGNEGTGDIASFYDLDQGIEVLHVGGNNGTFPNVGVKTSTPNVDFTVNGQISANNTIWSAGGNSNIWNNTFSTVSSLSSGWSSGGGVPTALSGNWQSTFSTVSGLSAGWNASRTWVNSNTANATFTTSVSAPSLSGFHYGDGSRLTNVSASFVSVAANVTAFNFTASGSLFTNNVVGSGNEIVFSDGQTFNSISNDIGFGANTISINFLSGVYIGGPGNLNTTTLSAITINTAGGNSNNWNSVYSTVLPLTAGWNASRTWVNSNTANATFTTSVSAPTLSASSFYASGNETVISDGFGSNDTGNGANTLSLNFANGVYIGGSGLLYTNTISAVNFITGSIQSSALNLTNSSVTFSSVSANSYQGFQVPTYTRLTADRTPITTGGDFFGSTESLVANGVYEVVYELYFVKTTAGTAIYSINSDGVNNITVNANWIQAPITGIGATGTATKAGVLGSTSTAVALPVTGSLTTAVNHHVTITALITNSNASNTLGLTITQSAGSITPKAGSYRKITRIA